MTTTPIDTVLLVHCDGTDGSTIIPDSATHGNAIVAGTAQLDTAQKKFGTASLLLNGSTDYITYPVSADWDFGTGDFTCDFWLRPSISLVGSEATILGQYNTGTDMWLCQIVPGPKLNFVSQNGGGVGEFKTTGTVSIPTGSLTHIAFVRNGSNCLLFVNGISQAVTQIVPFGTLPNTGVPLQIGRLGPGADLQYFPGHIDEIRIVKGVAIWTSNFTPPTSEYIIRAIQGRNIELRADTGFIVNEKISLIYNIYDKVNKTINFLYDNGFIVSNDLEYIYKSQESINRSLQFLYDNGLLVNKDLNVLFNSASFVNRDLPLRYFIEKIVTKDIVFPFDVGETVSNNIGFTYSLSSFVTKDNNFLYTIGALVNNDLETIYNTGSFVNRNITFNYGTADLVNKDLNLTYNLISFVNNSLEFIYGIQWDVRRQFRTLNNLLNFVSTANDINLKYNIFNVVNNDINLLYKLNNRISNDIQVLYNIYSKIYKDVELKFTIVISEDINELILNIDAPRKFTKGDTFTLDGKTDINLTNYKIRCSIIDSQGNDIRLATLNSGGLDSEIEIISIGEFVITCAKNLTDKLNNNIIIEIEIENTSGQIRTVFKERVKFEDQNLTWT